jgi:SAM-dependent methyltransferase
MLAIALAFFSGLYILITTKGGPSAPFIPLPQSSLFHLAEMIGMRDEDVFYDLGCGDGRVAHEVFRVNKKGRYIGIERNIFAYLLAQLRTKIISRRYKTRVITIIYGDILGQDLQDATRIVTYLFPEVMSIVLPKLERELKKGALLYSVSFKFEGKEPRETMTLHNNVWGLGREVYVYEF